MTPMPETAFTYDVLSGTPLEADLSRVHQLSPCETVIDSYVNLSAGVQSGPVAYIQASWGTQRFTLLTEDKTLSGSTVEFKWLVDTTTVIGNELATFTVTFTEPEAEVNLLPYFDPPLTSIIQIYK